MKKSQLFPLVGFLIGWGAPTGALILRYFGTHSSLSPISFVDQEWAENGFFYWYMMIGTCLVLTLVGFLLGRAEDSNEK